MFGKKKKIDEYEDEVQDQENIPSPMESAMPEKPNLLRITADIERLKGRVESLFEMKKADGERFTAINQSIGDVRKGVTEHDKQIGKIDAVATKSASLVSQVEPENLILEAKKTNARIDTLNAKLGSIIAVNQEIKTELQEARLLIKKFRGVDEVVNLSKEIQKEIFNLKKLSSKVKADADRTFTVFSDVSKKFADFERYKSIAKDLTNSFAGLQKDIQQMHVKTEAVITNEDFTKFKNEMDSKLQSFGDFENKLPSINKSIETMFNRYKEIDEKGVTTLQLFGTKFESFQKQFTDFTVQANYTIENIKADFLENKKHKNQFEQELTTIQTQRKQLENDLNQINVNTSAFYESKQAYFKFKEEIQKTMGVLSVRLGDFDSKLNSLNGIRESIPPKN